MALQVEVLGHGPVVRPEPGEGCDYAVVGSIAELREYLRPAIHGGEAFGADWEATSLNTLIAKPTGLGVSVKAKSARYVPVGHYLEPSANLPVMEVLKVLQEADNRKALSLWYNVLYDHPLMRHSLGWVPQHWQDVIYPVFLVDSNAIELGLKPSSLRFLGLQMQELTQLDTEWVQLSQKQRKLQPAKLPHQLPLDEVYKYGCADPDHTRQIYFHKAVQATLREQPYVLALEHKVSPVIQEGNAHGMYLDPDQLRLLEAEANALIEDLTPRIYAALGQELKLTRKQKLAELVSQLVPEITERTKQNRPTVSVKVLPKYAHLHPIIPLLIQYAKLIAQRDNYIRKLLRAHDFFATQPWASGRTRFAFHHIGVPTGRMKCGGGGTGKEAYLKGVADVNAQSIPDFEKAPDLPNVRSAFCAPPGFVVVSVDFNQVELRVPANLSLEPKWLQTLTDPDGDIHLTNAQAIADVLEPGTMVTKADKQRRGNAKTVSFALLFGGDEHTIARNGGLPIPDAKKILDAFYAGLPSLKAWIERVKASARTHGQIATFTGRMRRLRHYFAPEPLTRWGREWKVWRQQTSAGEREAINHPVQGGAADCFKLALLSLRQAVLDHGWGPDVISPIVHFVHDEAVWYVEESMVETVVPVLLAAMELKVKHWPMPLKADAEIGSRRLYIQEQVRQAMVSGHDPARWEAAFASLTGPDTGPHSTWGELVSYDLWRDDYRTRRGVLQSAAGGLVADETCVSAA